MPALEIDRLTKTYGSLRALDSLSFSVGAGEIFGFVGSNGAGKSTTMRIALGVLAADSGEVRWDGAPLGFEVRQQVGYMPEERGLYPKMKVSDQLVYLARLHGLDAAAARAAMEHWTEKLGVASRRGDEVQKLSLGNQQRVQLAAALVHDPQILVLDEPFSGLDPVAVDVMSAVLRERADAGAPVLFSSHQLELVERLCDRVGIIRAGSMVAAGTVDELRSASAPRWLVDAPTAPETWLPAAPGARMVSRSGTRTVVEVGDAPGAEQAVLQAVLAAGPVHEFSPQRASLSELFRHVVSQGDHDDAAPPPGQGPVAIDTTPVSAPGSKGPLA